MNNKGVERVKAADGRQGHAAAFGRIGVHIVKMGKIRRVFGIAVHGKPMAGRGGGGRKGDCVQK